MLHSQCNVSKFLIKLYFSYVIKLFSHSRHIDDELFVRSIKNISTYIIIECKIYYVSFKKNLQNLKHFQITNISILIYKI